MGASDNKMKILGNFLRVNCGRPSVTKLDDHMTARNRKLSHLFSVKNVQQTENVTVEGEEEDGKKKKKKETRTADKPVVFANNVEELLCLIMTERGLTPETSLVQIGIDDEQGLLKGMV